MKRILLSTLLAILILPAMAQTQRSDQLENMENTMSSSQNITTTATLKFSSRLFETKDDLTTVILIIPSGSVVTVLDSDSTYYHVIYEDYEGYIFKRHAVLNKTTTAPSKIDQQKPNQQEQPSLQQQENRFSYLENKYGSSMAARLYAGKIWKGMNSEMVKDSWGTPGKINRVISGDIIKEEWIYNNTWLYFENNVLLEWGPVKN